MFQDWADAYKHVHVREEDIPLQVVEWGGMYFVDRYESHYGDIYPVR